MALPREPRTRHQAILRTLARTLIRRGQDSDVWPVVLLLFAVLVPAVSILWFMGAAMRNERLAARQKLAEVYRGQLSATQERLAQSWRDTVAKLQTLAATASAPVAFAKCVQSGVVDSVVLFDEQGRVSYPNIPAAIESDFGELEPRWQEAVRLEHVRKHPEAANRYDALAREATSKSASARAFQAQVRCLVQAGQTDAAVTLVNEVFGGERYRHAADPQGRLIAANADLLALELITNRASPVFQAIAGRLAARLKDYQNPALAAPQRAFLMKELQRLSPTHAAFPTLAAEQLAGELLEHHPEPLGSPALERSRLPGLWQFTAPNRRVLALLRTDQLLAATKSSLAPSPALADVQVTLVSPDVDTSGAFVTLPAGEQMPGWRLALSLKDPTFLEATAGRRAALYLWTALLAVGGMGVLAVIAVRLVRRQMTFVRLKNDLAATVSHELKTPLSAMRVLVDTLLSSDKLDERQTREYLELIARENDRLGRLIHNFLTFSRMERKKYAFEFSPLPARQIVEAAIQSVHGRFRGPGCRLDVQIEDNLPLVLADPDALAAALINLLENAYKYSEQSKHIVLRARGDDGHVTFSVTDNGIGMTPREREAIFEPFHQVDQRLSRKGSGCGLGLSIVQFITTAHGGAVSVESQPGRGSTFTISLPASPHAASAGQEAIG